MEIGDGFGEGEEIGEGEVSDFEVVEGKMKRRKVNEMRKKDGSGAAIVVERRWKKGRNMSVVLKFVQKN